MEGIERDGGRDGFPPRPPSLSPCWVLMQACGSFPRSLRSSHVGGWDRVRCRAGIWSISATRLSGVWGSSVVLDLSLLIFEMGLASLVVWEAARATTNLDYQPPAGTGMQELFSDGWIMGKETGHHRSGFRRLSLERAR